MEWHFCLTKVPCVTGPASGRTTISTAEYSGRDRQVLAFRKILANNDPEVGKIETVCELGFNAGHGAAIWLEGTDVKLKSFDLLMTNWSAAAIQFNQAIYPGRTEWFPGNSAVTLPKYAEAVRAGKAERCDLWYIDGAHVGSLPFHDMKSAHESSRNGTVMIADDCTRFWGAVLTGVARMAAADLTRHSPSIPHKSYYDTHHGWCGAVMQHSEPVKPLGPP